MSGEIDNGRNRSETWSPVCRSAAEVRPQRPSRKFVFWCVAIVGIGAIILIADATIGEHWRRIHASDAVRFRINKLILETPPGLTDAEWGAAVRWTDNISVGSLLAFQTDLAHIKEFDTEVMQRFQDGVSMATIDWLWDRFAALTPSGRGYNERFRAQMQEYVEDARRNGDQNAEYAEFRENVRKKCAEGRQKPAN